jgi:hypothetical protein
MPLTEFQRSIALTLAKNRAPDSYLAGGAALHIEPNSKRYSNDLDYFNDSEERVAEAFAADRTALEQAGFQIEVSMHQPGFIRGIVRKGKDATKIDWAHDSAWRFLPPVKHDTSGFQLHEVDLAINKVLALAGRDEPRDFLDVIEAHQRILPLGALCWAAAGKDPGFTPLFLLSLLRRKGKYHAEDFERLMLSEKPDLQALKRAWLAALDEAETFIRSRPEDEIGCLYYSRDRQRFVAIVDEATTPHYGRPGGVLPRIA